MCEYGVVHVCIGMCTCMRTACRYYGYTLTHVEGVCVVAFVHTSSPSPPPSHRS